MSASSKAVKTDVSVSNQGSIFLIRPLTELAKSHLHDRCAGAQWFGGALVCEPRYVADLVENLQNDGFSVS